MDSKELRGLVEAYSEVYAPQEVNEAVRGEPSERRADLAAERRAGHRPLSAKEGEKYASYKMSQMAYAKRKRMGEEVDVFDTVFEFLQTEGYENPEQMMTELSSEEIDAILEASYSAKAARAGKDIGKPGKAFAKIAKEAGKRYGSKERGEKVAGAVLAKLRAKHEEVEYVGEAQAARENPEKYEAGEKKKYAPVRGEKTPMPPRGDKRREDFEKWYAANVR
jgi:hypothetical protein